MTLIVSADVLHETLTSLASARSVESVALWLAPNSERSRVARCYVPEHVARADMFKLTPNGMTDLRRTLRENRLFIAAQLHTHPREAFHSRADDAWALVRHVGALSIVLPRFAQESSPDTFFNDAAVFGLSERGSWDQIDHNNISTVLIVA